MLKPNSFLSFWRCYPALLYGISSLLGVYAAFSLSFLLLIPICMLWLPFFYCAYSESYSYKTFILSLFCLGSLWFYTNSRCQRPSLPIEGISGTAHISIHQLVQHSHPFGKKWIYEIQLNQFFPDATSNQSIAHGLKCTLSLPANERINRPLANQGYIIHAMLKQTEKGQYTLKVKSQEKWYPVKYTWSFAEIRYQVKDWLKQYIHHVISHPKSAGFLAGMATGEFDDRFMQMDFARFGLQHIMAISGFHFAILAGILSLIFRLIFPRSIEALLVMICLTAYFCLLGWSASILRSWMMIVLTLMGCFIEKPSKALNLLGFALLAALICDPHLAQTLGFQFSFLVTAAILLLYSSIDHFLILILPKRPLSQMVEMNGINQHGYYMLSLFRQGLALTIAVNAFAWPLTLYYFHQVPVMSLLYNLFFPLLVSLSLFLLLIGLLLSFLFSPLAFVIHAINSTYTKWILSLTSNLPVSLDVYWKIESFPAWLLVSYLSLLLFGSLLLKSWSDARQEI